LLLSLLCLPVAEAARPALDPVVRVHGGASYVPGPGAFGMTLGVDSRLTRTIFLDVGGFASPIALDALDSREGKAADNLQMRHALYTMPGLRIPHPQPSSFRWDVFVRAGFGILATKDRTPGYEEDFLQVDIAGLAGVDAQIMRGRVGLRGSAKGLISQPWHSASSDDVLYWGTQYSLEALVEF
jgi:hypothetical protein